MSTTEEEQTVPCETCDGTGKRNTVQDTPSGSDALVVECEDCAGAGKVSAEVIHARAMNREESCPLAVSECPECTAAAMDAGIPVGVIAGRERLPPREDSDEYRQEMIDAGRLIR